MSMYRFFWTKGLLAALLLLTTSFATAQMTCPVKTTDPTNLIGANPSFENSTVDFTSVEPINVNCNASNQKAAICNNPKGQSGNTYVTNIKDHTTGTGGMLFVDVNGTVADQQVYVKPSITVTPGTTYVISAWFANGNGNYSNGKWENSPVLSFNIKNNATNVTSQLGARIFVDSTSNPAVWQQFYQVWTAPPGVTNVDFIIQNEKATGNSNGNDLVIDDLVFNSSCDGIKDLSKIGVASTLIDTIFTCNEKFQLDLNTNLVNSDYNFQWFLNSAGNKVEGAPGMNVATATTKDNSSDNMYRVTSAPAHGSKYYVCYDLRTDGIVCPRLDSVLFLNEFNVDLGPGPDLCPPMSYTINPAITSDQVTYSWSKNPSATEIGNGSTYTATSAGTYKLHVTHANGGCTSPDKTITITEKTPAFTGQISRPCDALGNRVTGTAILKPTISGTSSVTIINGLANVAWYKDNNPASVAVSSANTATGETSVSAKLLDTTNASCPNGGLYLEDKNSFQTSVMSTAPCATSSLDPGQSGKYVVKFTSDVPFSINSLSLYPKWDDGVGESVTYQMKLYDGALSINTVRNTPPAALYSGPAESFYGGSADNKIKAVELHGPSTVPAGTYYLVINAYKTGNPSQTKEFYSGNCSTANSYSDPKGVFDVTNVYQDGNDRTTTMPGFINNLKLQVGNANSCGRVWVCASCVTVAPVEYTYFNVYPTGGQDVLITWGTAHESKNRVFVVEASSDGVNFTAVAEVGGSHNSHLQKDYSVQQSMIGERQYYRIKQVDHDGKFTYTPVKFVSLNGSDAIGEVYPQPVKHGEVLHVKINGLTDTQLTLKLQSISGFDISEQTVAIGENTEAITFNTAGLTAGVYLLLINNTDFAKTIRVVVE